jgi:hypothetical protein
LANWGSPAKGAELGTDVGKGKSFVTVASGVMRFTPAASILTTHSELPGEHLPSALASAGLVRTIGDTVYSYLPAAASLDGGRPWVRSRRKPPPKPGTTAAQVVAVLDSLAPTLAGPGEGSAGSFAKLIGYLNGAVSIQEGGSVAVDGQQTTEFTASLSIVKLLAGELSPEQLAKLEQDISKKPSEETVELEVFLAPSGLPVRTIGINGHRLEGFGLEEDILALEVPVVVHPPPARETIGQARLDKLERKHAKRQSNRCLRSQHSDRHQLCVSG